jgi:hypothetical protein
MECAGRAKRRRRLGSPRYYLIMSPPTGRGFRGGPARKILNDLVALKGRGFVNRSADLVHTTVPMLL